MRRALTMLFLLASVAGCGAGGAVPDTPDATMYFPPPGNADWQATAPASLGWDEGALQSLKDYLVATSTRSFMILVDGRIVIEEYFDGHDAAATWQWNSAGKTLLTAVTGIARQEGLLAIADPDNPSFAVSGFDSALWERIGAVIR